MKKTLSIAIFGLVVVFLSAMIVPAFAAKPTVLNDVWLVIPIFVKHPTASAVSIVPDKVWTSDEGTVLHSRYTEVRTYIAHTPSTVPPGTIRWGTMQAVSNFVFDTKTNRGTLNMKITLTLTTSTSSNNAKYPATDYPNTYGLGTLEGTLVAEVTSLNPYVASSLNCPMPGNAQGYFVATHGTGDFDNAKLEGDVSMNPGTALNGAIGIEYIFFGHHFDHLFNEGTLTFHNPGPQQ